MFRKVLLTIGLLLAAQVVAFAQGTMKGTITDEKTGEPLMSANVVAKQGGQIMGGARTDFDGNYTIKGLQVGKYEIEVSYMGYATVKTEINVKASGFTVYNEKLAKSGQQLKEVVVKAQKVPVIEIGTPESGARISADDIAKMPTNSVEGIVAAVAGVGYNDGGTGTARGEEGMVTQVGNVRTRTGVNVPKEAIAEIQVVLGGTPANIGEAIGGTQIITLKPPSSKLMGMVKYETLLDYRLWNSLVVWLTGPLAKTSLKDENGNKTGERTFLGFRFTGSGTYTKFGYYRAKDGRYQVVNDDKVMEIENQPLVYDPVERTVNYSAEYLRASDFVTITRPNAKNYYSSKDRQADFGSYSIDLQAALDFRFSELTSLVLTGEYDYSYGPSTSLYYFPLNLHNAANGVSKVQNFSITADFTQRFKDPEPVSDPSNPDVKIEPAVSKVMYNISAMFNRYSTRSYNEKFGDDVFKYGHIATFNRTQTPSYEIRSDYNYHGTTQTAHIQNSWIENSQFVAPSEYNPILSNYTTQLFNIPSLAPYLSTFDGIRSFNGLVNGTIVPNVYGRFYNVGVQNTSYSKSENNYYYVSAKAAATVKGHDLEIGFNYDQYTAASYGLSAYQLWTLMRQSANAHISQLDFSSPIEHFVDGDLYVDYNRLNGGGQTCFDESLRRALGLDVNGSDWLDIDRYSPEDYNNYGGINMFSANELFNSGNQIVSYFGYDHTGEKYNARTWSLDDFFDPVSRGHKNFQYLPAFSPIYAAGYIQDKFFFQDLIFNVGVRVDYYDGNQMVLKDPYLLYESYTVGDLNNGMAAYTTGLANNAFPAGAKDDWVVYVDDANSTNPTIRGYRDGSIWYNADGVQVSSHSAVAGESGRPTPYRTTGEGGGQQTATIGNGSGNRISANAFKDCCKGTAGISGVTIGNIENNATGGYTIAAGAFEGCNNLATVTIGNVKALKAIGAAAFGNQLKNVTIGSVITSGAAFELGAFVWGDFSGTSLTLANGTGEYLSQTSADKTAPSIIAGTFDFSNVKNTAAAATFDWPTVTIGETANINCTEEGVKYTSSNTEIATVDENTGAVTGVAKGSTTIVISKDGMLPNRVTVTVTNPSELIIEAESAPEVVENGTEGATGPTKKTSSSTVSGGYYLNSNPVGSTLTYTFAATAGNYSMTMTSRNYGSAIEDLSTACEIKINDVAVNLASVAYASGYSNFDTALGTVTLAAGNTMTFKVLDTAAGNNIFLLDCFIFAPAA